VEKWWNKAQKVGLVAIIALIPTQLGRHWWPEWSLVSGIPVDYLSPTLYLLDIVWLVWLVTRVAGGEIQKLKISKWWVVMALVNILAAQNRWAAVEGWARWIEWWTVIGAVAANKEWVKKNLVRIIPLWILIEAGLSLAQVVGGGSVGGVFWLLGERRFSLNSIGAALWSVEGAEWVRAAGTFSHPNSLAGFTLLVAGWWWTIKSNWGKTRIGRVVGWATILGAGMIIVLSASRTVWVLTVAGALMIGRQFGGWRQKVGMGLLGAGLVVVLLGVIGREYRLSSFVSGWDGAGVQKRIVLLEQAGKMIKTNPLLGIGLNNWFNEQAKSEVRNAGWRQPVHNVVALWWAETGLMGMLVAGWTLKNWIKNRGGRAWLVMIFIIGLTGMVDHYWLTLPQNRWLWGVILAIM